MERVATSAKMADRRSSQQGVIAAAVAFAVLSASLGNFLGFHSYPTFRSEVALVTGGLLMASALYGLWYGVTRQIGRTCAEGLLVFLAIDLNTDVKVLPAIALALVVLILGARMRFSVLPVLGSVGISVVLTSLVELGSHRLPLEKSSQSVSLKASNKPAVLHIILDAHGGIASLPAGKSKAAVKELYSRHGFLLFERAYSRHFHTVNAIPDMLNFGSAGSSRPAGDSLDIGRTRYLYGLERQGYRLHIYQSEFADYCQYSEFASCTRYWSPSLAFIDPTDISAREKARLIAYKLAGLSELAVMLGDLSETFLHDRTLQEGSPPVVKKLGLSSTLGAFAVLDRLASDVRNAQPTDLYFAHVLAPHNPYVFGPDCSVLAPSRWHYRRSSSSMEERKQAYSDQVACLTHRLEKVLANFAASPGGENGIVVIHGDHGSRLTKADPDHSRLGRLEAADLIASYSTLFAIKSPVMKSGIEKRQFAVPDLLAGLTATHFTSVDRVEPGSGKVFLNGPGVTTRGEISISDAWPVIQLTQSSPVGSMVP